ncbi:hypothetical protein XBKB1_1420072 [Xenorhabdus bovienii str. kraussei Becker Underwood]|uniref:Uncharacterized protein n=1 Tax=Xenorhabdus bovienii str. kraussei Becker Underwood TaxID=1398204 RepID=A0A077PPR7_XENBV|nr:hypothetical protein XBKB1_1420072 [Xenorhabdus bovienii str. kraussei Becker Underwood]
MGKGYLKVLSETIGYSGEGSYYRYKMVIWINVLNDYLN